MEKAKLALLAVIALALSVQTWGRVVPEAHAQSMNIECKVWDFVGTGASKSEEKRLTHAMGHADEIRAWLLAHPGDIVFRTTLPDGGMSTSSIDIACVRTQ